MKRKNWFFNLFQRKTKATKTLIFWILTIITTRWNNFKLVLRVGAQICSLMRRNFTHRYIHSLTSQEFLLQKLFMSMVLFIWQSLLIWQPTSYCGCGVRVSNRSVSPTSTSSKKFQKTDIHLTLFYFNKFLSQNFWFFCICNDYDYQFVQKIS